MSVRRRDLEPVLSSQVDTVAISGTAVGGTTALARAGYGQTITASTCGHAIKVSDTPSLNILWSPVLHSRGTGVAYIDHLFRRLTEQRSRPEQLPFLDQRSAMRRSRIAS